MPVWTTYGVLITTGVVLFAWDVIVALDGEPNNTITRVLRRTARKWLILPFAFGVIMGHLWQP